ncbi:MAG TPA: acyl-CoA dehydrogenase [Acidimicrobiales bacterium]|jgi:alkylation response protein AidB-like acyl-CoA dehydrogenase|nr:acyl-CoA dehydrogenase [Acidimicrobiales bacterium]MDP7208710.1 acyl-CoA dehydrogenase [Acidimicrobiales bacterium]HJL89093.1 acyl-CoA dehydrogenase [Acidimicrobiales bacterium]HJO99413.1 acyl-CoA dehydrogenase [Acidimicrobiales bacterium]|tara:strand:+ start:28374 stop:30176 length:1803 start_codon:yes stop_codon:yes gene_type:complete
MTDFKPPLDDIRLVLAEIGDIGRLCDLPDFDHVDVDTIDGVLDELGRFVAEVIAPTNRIGDEQGCSVTDGVVTVPDEFHTAWDQYVTSGWGAISQDPEYGGGGFPGSIQTVLTELLAAANRAWSMGPMLTVGALDALHAFGDEGQRETYIPKMVTAEWSGTMNLTEPQAGSDVGALTTKAVLQDDGTYRIFGTKIFITFGEHELAENIIQMVLARTPDSPPGTRGISLFIVPKYLVADDGSPGERNDYTCVSVEHKLGLHASPTCVMSYGESGEGAVGYLVGEEHQGMRYMFKMMNNARLGVGVEGLAVTERALQLAADFALERRQGTAVGAQRGEQSAIVEHADVRRMLLTMRAYTDAMRCLLYLNSSALDVAGHHPDPETRQAAAERAELLTPISKAWCTDVGVEMASLGIQVHGGYGYIEETGAAQHLRDARISPIYEGTNGIQAIDLVGRKLSLRAGGVMSDLLDEIAALDGALEEAGDDFDSIRSNLADGLAVFREATAWIINNGVDDPNEALAAATPYLKMFGQVVGGWLLARLALGARRRLDEGTGDSAHLEGKIVVARFYAEQLLPTARAQLGAVTAGASDLFAMSADGFSA